SEDMTIRLWSVPDRELLRTFDGHLCRIWSIDFSADGCYLASGGTDRSVRIWEIASGRCVNSLWHDGWVRCIRFRPDGSLLASASDDLTVRIWDWRHTTNPLHTFSRHTNSVWSLTFAPDGQTLMSGSEDATMRQWDLQSGACVRVLQGH